jgi:ABC-type glycerol-3-phosphate transport system substrate-binding protein
MFRKLLFICLASLLVVMPAISQDVEPVRVATGWGSAELDAFVQVLDASGIAYELLTFPSIHTDLGPLVAAGNAPDIAQMPRPGVVASFARDGALIPLSSGDDPVLSQEMLDDNFPPSIVNIGIVDGELVGLMVKVSSKGTFWYKPSSLEALGAEIPTTFEELVALGDAYVANGQVPFMLPAGSAWTLTDWFETLYISVAGPEMYNGLFVTHEVEWTDPTVVETLELFRQIFDPVDERIGGGLDGALSFAWRDGADGVFRAEDPAAELFLLGSFAGNYVEETFDLVCGEDFDFFDFPEPSDEFGDTLMGGGDMVIMFNDRPEVREMMRWLASAEAATIWATTEVGSILPPNINVPLDVFSPCMAKEAAQIGASDVFVFDGSDLAPGAVGGDAMFIALQDFLADPDSMMDILEALEDAADAAYD